MDNSYPIVSRWIPWPTTDLLDQTLSSVSSFAEKPLLEYLSDFMSRQLMPECLTGLVNRSSHISINFRVSSSICEYTQSHRRSCLLPTLNCRSLCDSPSLLCSHHCLICIINRFWSHCVLLLEKCQISFLRPRPRPASESRCSAFEAAFLTCSCSRHPYTKDLSESLTPWPRRGF